MDLFVAGYVEISNDKTTSLPGSGPNCIFKGVAVYCGPRGLHPDGTSYLYHNNGDGTFTDFSEAAEIRKAAGCYGLGVLTADFENRGWPDIYEACDSVASLFYQNNGDGTFTERGVEAGVAYTEDGLEQAGMGISAGDYDGDGFLDILKTNFDDDVPDLYYNERDSSFTLRTFDAKLGSNLKRLSWGGGVSITTKTDVPTSSSPTAMCTLNSKTKATPSRSTASETCFTATYVMGPSRT